MCIRPAYLSVSTHFKGLKSCSSDQNIIKSSIAVLSGNLSAFSFLRPFDLVQASDTDYSM